MIHVVIKRRNLRSKGFDIVIKRAHLGGVLVNIVVEGGDLRGGKVNVGRWERRGFWRGFWGGEWVIQIWFLGVIQQITVTLVRSPSGTL